MRNKILIILLSGLFMILIVVFNATKPLSPDAAPVATKSPDHGNAIDIKFENQNLKVSYFKVSDVNKISLRPNFDDKFTSTEILEKENCEYLANGGFYDENEKPIGLFVIGEKKSSEKSNSSLFNGFVNISEGAIYITQEPQDSDISLQTGPILVKDGYERNLSLRNDEFARRIILVRSDEVSYFFAIYHKDSQISGPLLADMPEITNLIAEKLGITIIDAINLDGGSASAFFDGTSHLKELSPIGSYFCIN